MTEWQKEVMKKLKNIILSRQNYRKDNILTLEQQQRLKICKSCPLNSDNKKVKSFRDKIFIKLNKFFDFLFDIKVTEEAICTECGCNLIHKTSQTEENCPKKKW